MKGYFRVTSSASAVDITPGNLTQLNGLLEVAQEAAKENIPQNQPDDTVAVGPDNVIQRKDSTVLLAATVLRSN